ncbi:DUF1294 domain-containing protein [Anaerovibrio sp. JC8]|uniref:DUF1294 domain-containing protein n=1 Tax=Anaerovibrio sp. JC8 TaxID=1240085 RepID=UPI000A10A700|nr:DUF1294 domain-containing protein [Anaerovibrio sp. JC8]
MNVHEILMWYLVIINIIAVAVYGWDKMCAIRHKWRVPEKTLLAIAVIGGSLGALFAMSLFHHKTLHLKFKYGVPVIMLLQVVGVYYLHAFR